MVWVLILGHDATVLAVARWTAGLSAQWTLADVASLPGAPPGVGQFEAVEYLPGTTAGVLCEDPPLLLAVDVHQRRVVGRWQLIVDLPGRARSGARTPVPGARAWSSGRIGSSW